MAAVNFFEALEKRALEAGHAIAAIDGITAAASKQGLVQSERGPPAQVTYAQLHTESQRLAAALAAALHDACPGLARGLPEAPVLATWMRRGTGWYCVFWAAARLQVPLVALSCDLPDRSVEQQRNSEILAEHRPALLIADRAWHSAAVGGASAEAVAASLTVVQFADLWSRSRAALAEPREVGSILTGSASADAVLCYCYTGGTTKASRCAIVTHRMALYEVATYPHIARLGHEDRVLQQHSLYWGASAYGEVDIALAFGCALIFCEAWDTEGVSTAIRQYRASCAGLVPSVLAALEHRDVPSLKLVFTWGEALQARVAREWAQHVHLLDLLISTECWLSLYADWGNATRGSSGSRCGSADKSPALRSGTEETKPSFHTVPGTIVRLRPVTADRECSGTSRASLNGHAATGELLVAGPQVSPGYTNAKLNKTAFEFDADGTRWYCTKDCLERRTDGGFGFAGRADDLVKVGGAWVDVREVEARIFAVHGVAEACICHRDVFVVLHELHEGIMQELHAVLPADFALFVVQALPRRAGTGKVDRQLLNGFIRVGPIAARDDKEALLCTRELNSITAWYAVLLLPPLISSIFWAWGEHSPLEELFSYRGWLRSECANISETPSMLALCRSVDFRDAADISLQILLQLLWIFLQIICRLLCIIYATMSLYTRSVPDEAHAWFRICPCGLHGFIVLVCSCVPPPPSYFCLVAPLLGLHGCLHAAMRQRLFSWPLVCLLGLPFWLRKDGLWMWRWGFFEVLRWYWKNYVVGSLGNPLQPLKRKIGLERTCAACHKTMPVWNGKSDPAVDKEWYCNPCWKHYHNHKECKKCKQWAVKGSMTAEGAWQCSACDLKARRAASGLGVGSSSSSSNSSAARAAPSTNNPKSPRSITIKLQKPAAPDVAMGTEPDKSRKRPADDTQQLEASPATRRRTANGTSSNGVHKEESPEGPCKRFKLEDGTSSPQANGRTEAVTARVPELTPEPATAMPERMKSREWKIIEKATGMTFNSSNDSVLALDSLRQTKMASALRREAGKRLTRETLKRAASLQDLLDEVERLPSEECELVPGASGGSVREYAIWGMMWGSKCQWVFRRNRPLSEPVLRAALAQLMERHEALRTELRDPLKLFSATQQALTGFDLWQRYAGHVPSGAKNSRSCGFCCIAHCIAQRLINTARRYTAPFLIPAVRWSLLHAWPKIGAGRCAPEDVPLRVFQAVATAEEADARLWRGGPGRCPPFQASLIAFGQGTSKEGALVHLAVSHMMSDGFCVVPLLDDLAYLVASVERRLPAPAVGTAAAVATGASAVPNGHPVALASAQAVAAETPLPPLPPVRSVFEVLEARIGETVHSGCVSSIDASGTCITREPIVPKGWFDAACYFGHLPPEVVGALRGAAARLGVPDDIAMLTVLGIALSWFENRKRELIAMIVPQRDGPGHNDMVGLFADLRHLSVCSDGLNFVGVALRLHHIVKERLWSAPGLAMQYDMTFVNFEWTDFEERYGFTQHVNLIERSESSFHPLRIAVDQPSRDAWRMRVAFHKTQYNEERRNRFFELFERSLHKFVESPLEPVWPNEPATTPAATVSPGSGSSPSRAQGAPMLTARGL